MKKIAREGLNMNILMHGFFIIVIGYFCYNFIVAIMNMNRKKLVPITEEERTTLYIYPQKPVAKPHFAEQKNGIMIYSVFLIYLIVMYILGTYFIEWNWTLLLLLFLPLLNMGNLINLFVVTEDGIVRGPRFVSWKGMKSYQFNQIDFNHKFYGVSEEVNKGYELIVKTSGISIRCIVTSEKVKEKMEEIFQKNDIKEMENNS